MSRRRSDRGESDEIGWIAFTDFFAAVALVFLLLFAVRSSSGSIQGDVLAGNGTVAGCEIKLEVRSDTTDLLVTVSNDEGRYDFPFLELRPPVDDRATDTVLVSANCRGYSETEVIRPVLAADTTLVINIQVDSLGSSGLGGVELGAIGAADLFLTDSSTLKASATGLLRARKDTLIEWVSAGSERTIAIIGHTDDQPYSAASPMNNWILSGQRAAAVAAFMVGDTLDGRRGLDPCQVVIMGYGPVRPAQLLLPNDREEARSEKRTANRRIEFQQLEGQSFGGGQPGVGC